ncbi:MAG TPA: hypothetical protein VFJ77_08585 [Gaiellaceae bacterium]|nr:hypothetical protein [Gaiellaceae bacterium]
MSGGPRDEWVRERLARLAPPPRRRGFEDELWERVQARERAAARRWRLASVALAAVAVAATAAAAVLATARAPGATIDRTFACTTQVQGGLHTFALEAWPRDPQLPAAGVRLTTRTQTLMAFNTFGRQPLAVDGSGCRAVRRTVPLSPAGLRSAGSFGVGYVHFSTRCLLGGRVLVHLRLRTDGRGRPVAAQLALRLEKRNRPVAYVRWSPKRVVASVTPSCD